MKRILFLIVGLSVLSLVYICNAASKETNTVTDIDGNVYHTVTIGTQTWTVENLKTTKFNDGTAIPNVTDSATWANLTTPGYCWYNNDAAIYKNRFGALYNWYVINTGLLAPTGWHVPTDLEWETLHNYLIAHGYNYDSTTTGNYIAKAMAAQTAWYTSTNTGAIGNNLSTNNRSSFSALPGGCRVSDGGFYGVGSYGNWWSATEGDVDGARNCNLGYNDRSHGENDLCKSYGFSVRLVRDN